MVETWPPLSSSLHERLLESLRHSSATQASCRARTRNLIPWGGSLGFSTTRVRFSALQGNTHTRRAYTSHAPRFRPEIRDLRICNVSVSFRGLLFIWQGLLTNDDQNALESSALAGDVVINAAFAVALHSQDLDYLSALFKDIATNRRDNPQVLLIKSSQVEPSQLTVALLCFEASLPTLVSCSWSWPWPSSCSCS